VAVAGVGPVARALCQSLLGRPLGGLSGVVGEAGGRRVVVILGEEARLPWVDGVVYLGRDPEAPGVLLPTRQRPALPVDLFARGVRLRLPESGWPAAVLADAGLFVPTGAARALGRDQLQAAALP
jgi:hypothetical protein